MLMERLDSLEVEIRRKSSSFYPKLLCPTVLCVCVFWTKRMDNPLINIHQVRINHKILGTDSNTGGKRQLWLYILQRGMEASWTVCERGWKGNIRAAARRGQRRAGREGRSEEVLPGPAPSCQMQGRYSPVLLPLFQQRPRTHSIGCIIHISNV